MKTFKEYYIEEESSKLDKLQLALDVAGIEPTVGTVADGTNAIISALRLASAAARKDKDAANKILFLGGQLFSLSIVSLFLQGVLNGLG